MPSDWRFRRTVVRVNVNDDQPVLDLGNAETVSYLREELAYPLSLLGYKDLDHGILRGPDRRVTRLVADWAYGQSTDDVADRYGIRYKSRLTDDECWAMFPDVGLEVLLSRPVSLDDPALRTVASRFELQVF